MGPAHPACRGASADMLCGRLASCGPHAVCAEEAPLAGPCRACAAGAVSCRRAHHRCVSLQVALVSRYWTWPFILFVLLSYWLVYPFEVTSPRASSCVTPLKSEVCACVYALRHHYHAHLLDLSC